MLLSISESLTRRNTIRRVVDFHFVMKIIINVNSGVIL